MRSVARWQTAAACLAAALPCLPAQKVTYSPKSESLNTSPLELARHLGGSEYSTRFEDVTWDNDAWTLTTTTARPHDYHAMGYTANGYFGATMASTGPFFQAFNFTQGWPVLNQRQSFGTVSGFFDRQPTTEGNNYEWLYQYGWDSVISGIPNWGPLIMEMSDGNYLAANTSLDQLSDIQLTHDFKRGRVQWMYTWTPPKSDGLNFNVTYMAFTHKLNVNRGYSSLDITASQDCKFTLYSILDGRSAVRTTFNGSGEDGNMIYTGINPNGVDNVTAWMYSAVTSSDNKTLSPMRFNGSKNFIGDHPATIVQAFNVSLQAKTPETFFKHVGVASTDGFEDPQSVARSAVQSSSATDTQTILQSHEDEWAAEFPKTTVSDYTDPSTGLLPADAAIIEKALVSVVSTFNLIMNTISSNALSAVSNAPININGISVCGLVSDCYGGQRFWDQDIWMHPHMAIVFPAAAQQVTNLRVAQYPQARRNVQTAFTSSRNDTYFSENAAVYPWTSGRDANCTATGPCWDYEYHLNSDIVYSFFSEWTATGDTNRFKSEFYPVINSAATLFSELLQKNGSKWSLVNMTDPDEYSNNQMDGSAGLLMLSSVLNASNFFAEYFGGATNETWQSQAQNLQIPTSGDITLEYSGMDGTIVVKQADVVLNIYPIITESDYTVTKQIADLDYYAAHQSPNGPAMTWAIFSVAANAISPSGCSAYTYDSYGWSPYVRAPWFGFSEQLVDDPSVNGGTDPAYPFLTGHGGALQVDTFGYLGIRRKTDWTLYLNPSLPPQISNLVYPTFFHHGWPIIAWSNQTHTTVAQQGDPLGTANMTLGETGIPVIVIQNSDGKEDIKSRSLLPNQTLTIANRQYGNNLTEPGNVLQCKKVTSAATTTPGLFAMSAVDGAGSTFWQPETANPASSLTVDTSDTPFQQLKYAYFDWGTTPPTEATVILHNYTDLSSGQMINITNIKISQPYNASTAGDIKPYVGNSTNITLQDGVWSSHYVTLMIQGNSADKSDNATGATVAEFALVGDTAS